MRILNYIPRQAFMVFFWCAIVTAILCLGSTIVFLVFMPDNEPGRRAVVVAVRAFSPSFTVAVAVAAASFWVLRATRRHFHEY